LHALARGHTAFARILFGPGPVPLVDMRFAGEDAAAPIDAVHVFTFGGVRRTAKWMQAFR